MRTVQWKFVFDGIRKSELPPPLTGLLSRAIDKCILKIPDGYRRFVKLTQEDNPRTLRVGWKIEWMESGKRKILHPSIRLGEIKAHGQTAENALLYTALASDRARNDLAGYLENYVRRS